MRKIRQSVVTFFVLLSLFPTIASASVIPGTKCSKAGIQQVYKGKIFTCLKLGAKLYWNNGRKYQIVTPTPTPTPTPTLTPTLTPTILVPPKLSILSANFADSDILIKFDVLNEPNVAFGDFKVEVYDSLQKRYLPINSGNGYPASVFMAKKNFEYEFQIPAKELAQSVGINSLISNITKIRIQFIYFNKSIQFSDRIASEWIESSAFVYVSNLPRPEFTLSSGVDTYIVQLNIDQIRSAKNYYGAIVEELVTAEVDKAKVSLTGAWRQATSLSKDSTVIVFTPDGLARWVRVKFISIYGGFSLYSDIVRVVPKPFMP